MESLVVSQTIVPYTYLNTNLHTRHPGDRLNLETDVLAKYVEKMFSPLDLTKPLTIERRKDLGC